MSRPKKRRERKSPEAIHTESSSVGNKGAGVKLFAIVGVLILTTVSFGAFIKWRGTAIGNERAERASAPLLLPTPEYAANKPVKEYVHAPGGKLLAVSEPNRTSDLAVWRVSTGTWYVIDENGTTSTQTFGLPTDLPAPGDYS